MKTLQDGTFRSLSTLARLFCGLGGIFVALGGLVAVLGIGLQILGLIIIYRGRQLVTSTTSTGLPELVQADPSITVEDYRFAVFMLTISSIYSFLVFLAVIRLIFG